MSLSQVDDYDRLIERGLDGLSGVVTGTGAKAGGSNTVDR